MAQKEGLPPFPSHLTITTYTDWPYSRIVYENGTLVGQGIAFEVLALLMKKLNFTYTIKPPDQDIIGDEHSGMISLLNKKEVDMAVAFIPILSEFRNFCDFSSALDEMDTTFLMERPGTSHTGSGLFAPFSRKVWHMIFICLLIVGPTIYLMVKIRQKFTQDSGAEKFTFMTCLWFAYGALLKQGTTSAPIGDSVRLVFASWWIFITILTSFYTANLTAFLTLSKFTIALNSIQDLVNSGDSWFVTHGRSVETLIRYDYPELKSLIQIKNKYGYVTRDYNMSYKSMLSMIDSNKIYIADRILVSLAIFENYRNKTRENVVEDKRCAYVISESNVLPKRRGFGFPKDSIILKYLGEELMTIVERGLIHHFKSEKLPEAQICPLNLKSKERQLRVSDLMITYKVVFSGMGMAVIIFLLEILSRALKVFSNFDCLRKCCKTEMKGSDAVSIEPWEYSRKDDSNFWIRTPPPVYQMNEENAQKTYTINGRDYYIVKEETGDQRLIPIRTPSAYLFQYIH